MIDLPSSDLQVVEAALGRLVFGQDEAGTDMPNSSQKFGQIKRKSRRKIFSFPSPSVKHNLARPRLGPARSRGSMSAWEQRRLGEAASLNRALEKEKNAIQPRLSSAASLPDICLSRRRYLRNSGVNKSNKAGRQLLDIEGLVARCRSTSTVPPRAVSRFFKTRRVFVMRLKNPMMIARHCTWFFNHYREVVTKEEVGRECQAPILWSGANEEQLDKLADEFLLGDPEIINPAFILKNNYFIVFTRAHWSDWESNDISEERLQDTVGIKPPKLVDLNKESILGVAELPKVLRA